MLWDAIRSYVQLATGVTEATTDKAKEVAQGLLSAVGITNSNEVAAQVSGMADEILNAARDQRDSFVNLVRAEVTTVIDSSGVAKAADVDVLTSRLAQLAVEVEALVGSLPGGSFTPAGIRSRRRAETTDGHAERTGEAAVSGDSDAASSASSAPARKRAARTAAPAKKSAPAPRARAAGTRKTAAANKSTTADEGTTPRRTARKSASSDEGSAPRKSARKSASAEKATAPRKSASKRTSPRKSARANQSEAPLIEGSDPQQAQSPASGNG